MVWEKKKTDYKGKFSQTVADSATKISSYLYQNIYASNCTIDQKVRLYMGIISSQPQMAREWIEIVSSKLITTVSEFNEDCYLAPVFSTISRFLKSNNPFLTVFQISTAIELVLNHSVILNFVITL